MTGSVDSAGGPRPRRGASAVSRVVEQAAAASRHGGEGNGPAWRPPARDGAPEKPAAGTADIRGIAEDPAELRARLALLLAEIETLYERLRAAGETLGGEALPAAIATTASRQGIGDGEAMATGIAQAMLAQRAATLAAQARLSAAAVKTLIG